jgi:hypothetical protein
MYIWRYIMTIAKNKHWMWWFLISFYYFYFLFLCGFEVKKKMTATTGQCLIQDLMGMWIKRFLLETTNWDESKLCMNNHIINTVRWAFGFYYIVLLSSVVFLVYSSIVNAKNDFSLSIFYHFSKAWQ